MLLQALTELRLGHPIQFSSSIIPNVRTFSLSNGAVNQTCCSRRQRRGVFPTIFLKIVVK